MANYENVINKSKAYKMVLKDKDANRLSHTYILISEDQDYAFEFAKKMASVMLDVENKHASLLKIQKDIHPDVLLFGKDSKIMVADAEKIVSDVLSDRLKRIKRFIFFITLTKQTRKRKINF